MSHIIHLATIVARQVAPDEATTTVPLTGQPGHCDTGNEYDGNLGLRISAIFVILVGSLFGTDSRVLVQHMTILTTGRRVVSHLHPAADER